MGKAKREKTEKDWQKERNDWEEERNKLLRNLKQVSMEKMDNRHKFLILKLN